MCFRITIIHLLGVGASVMISGRYSDSDSELVKSNGDGMLILLLLTR